MGTVAEVRSQGHRMSVRLPKTEMERRTLSTSRIAPCRWTASEISRYQMLRRNNRDL